ncbi:MAG: NAD-dependent deacylase [Chitinophagia bacterium]|nr:NAD-dependent deacylase [Chitinophagia bacterium]
MDRKRIAVLTGAGISAESGLQTFRDAGGLWNGYAIEQVATPEAWEEDPQRVLDFYNMRRREAAKALPNAAHFALAALDVCHDVTVITQNVDDLHERAGSGNILHLHGELVKMRSERDTSRVYHWTDDIRIGDLAEDGGQLRPHIVWFGEEVPMLGEAIQIVREADIFVIVGTSMQVYPAAGLIDHFREGGPVYVIDKVIPYIPYESRYAGAFFRLEKPATEGVVELLSILGCAG